MALKSRYRVCEIKKLDLIFSSFNVRSQNHSYKNSIVFRLARHLCTSTSLVHMYVCMDGTYVIETRVQVTFFSKKHDFLGLTPVYSEITALSKPYYILKLQSVRKFLRKCLLFKKQKVDSTGYYGIEDLFPDLISKLRHFMGGNGVPVVSCQEPLVVRMP